MSNDDVTFLRNVETAMMEKNQKRNTTTTIVAIETTMRNRKKQWKLSETAPSCNDCVATIVTEPFTPAVKGVGTVCLSFRKGNKDVISPDSRIRRGLET